MLSEKLRSKNAKSQDTLETESRYFDETAERDEIIYEAICSDSIINSIADEEKKDAISDALELYLTTKKTVAPVIAGFANDLLQKADNRQVIFAARDGLGPYIAANALIERFPGAYTVGEKDMVFAYLTRRVVGATDPAVMKKYLEQEGVRDTAEPVVIADIGMYGTIMHGTSRSLPRAEAAYLISRNPSIPGYADNDHSRKMKAFNSIIGNPAVHFMEDTFSGLTSSPDHLEDKGGRLVPNYEDNAYEPKELLKRKYAIQAMADYVKDMRHLPSKEENEEAVRALDALLVDPLRYSHLMVPHIR